jgi:hypothetical protein
MKNRSISRILIAMTPMMIVCVVLALGASAVAQSGMVKADHERCSNKTLSGDYGFTVEGTLLGPGFLLRAVVMQHYDGKGNITQVDHVVVNGVSPAQEWTPGTGTYTVNPDCTGAEVLDTPSVPAPLHIHFVVVNNGKQIYQVVDDAASTAVGIRVN